ncbi:hypothetical protein [Chitinivibrio alkaliphilus]|uniref:Uncharacterized protein n=1 Tax=Chitinivibrio alkaliphilus ACht1 TaxID=1313304 RepID=U7DBZ9_9BACT|nr:hypothetical protein [Chitinivibrio alkaliphilus]ERP39108.1 hypothetical protein CALK_0274 [Chitinivibrio alkaliphilus ACht1]
MNNLFNILQKKGDPHNMAGLLTVYARLENSEELPHSEENRIENIIQNGLLVAQGNYRDQNSLRDFLRQEFGGGGDDEEGMHKFIESLGGIEGALDPDKFRDKLKELESMEDYIPTPAKMVAFSSEEEILHEEGDIYYLGVFNNTANANLAVNAITILYQAKYREAQIVNVRGEIDSMISQLETGGAYKTVQIAPEESGDVKGVLLRKFIPELIHSRENDSLRTDVEEDVRRFLSWYEYPEDVATIFALTRTPSMGEDENQYLSLLVEKVDALGREDFDRAAMIMSKIRDVRGAEDA